MKTAVLPYLLDEIFIDCTCAAHSKVLSSATESLLHIDKTNKQQSFTAALRPVFFSIPLSTDKGNKQGTQEHTSLLCHRVWGEEGRVRKSSQSSPFLVLTPLSSVLSSSPATADSREVLSSIHTPPHLSRGWTILLVDTCKVLLLRHRNFCLTWKLPCGTWTDICSSSVRVGPKEGLKS